MSEKSYASVAGMARDLALDADVLETVEGALDRQKIVRQLMALRAARGLSQSDIAEVMRCSQSRVSKMESSADDELRYGDLRQYAHAVGCELESAVRPKNLEPAEEVKCLAIAIRDRFSRMADLAQDDEEIAAGVAQFFVEALFNFSIIIGKAAKTLPKNPDGSPRLEVHFGVGDRRDAERKGSSAKATPRQEKVFPRNSP